MARVDPDDDDIRRFIVRHYRYDPERHERRHVVIAAFDNEHEFNACMKEASAEIDRRKNNGEQVDPAEHVSGIVHEPGYRRRAASRRLVFRALDHGADPHPRMDDLDLPSAMASYGPAPAQRGWADRLRRLIPPWRSFSGS